MRFFVLLFLIILSFESMGGIAKITNNYGEQLGVSIDVHLQRGRGKVSSERVPMEEMVAPNGGEASLEITDLQTHISSSGSSPDNIKFTIVLKQGENHIPQEDFIYNIPEDTIDTVNFLIGTLKYGHGQHEFFQVPNISITINADLSITYDVSEVTEPQEHKRRTDDAVVIPYRGDEPVALPQNILSYPDAFEKRADVASNAVAGLSVSDDHWLLDLNSFQVSYSCSSCSCGGVRPEIIARLCKENQVKSGNGHSRCAFYVKPGKLQSSSLCPVKRVLVVDYSCKKYDKHNRLNEERHKTSTAEEGQDILISCDPADANELTRHNRPVNSYSWGFFGKFTTLLVSGVAGFFVTQGVMGLIP